jgi:hypothetical protein
VTDDASILSLAFSARLQHALHCRSLDGEPAAVLALQEVLPPCPAQ